MHRGPGIMDNRKETILLSNNFVVILAQAILVQICKWDRAERDDKLFSEPCLQDCGCIQLPR